MPHRDYDPRYSNANDETEIFPSSYSDRFSGRANSGYQDGYYSDPRERQEQHQTQQYARYQDYQQVSNQSSVPQQSRSQEVSPSVSDQFDIPKFIGSVVAVAAVASITAYVVAWILELVMERIATYVDWAYPPIDRTYYAIFAAVVALLAALLWWVLNIGTTLPSLFYSWIVGVLLVAAVVLPLLLTTPLYNGVVESIMNLVVGLPVVYLIAPIGNSAVRR